MPRTQPDTTAGASLDPDLQCTAFSGRERVAGGRLADVLPRAHAAAASGRPVLVIDDLSGQSLEVHLTGSLAEACARLGGTPAAAPAAVPPKSPRGRPKLGVVAREVTLLPRHWAWLGEQPGGASAALRRLVEQARRDHADEDRQRRQRQVVLRAMTTLMGDEPGFEEATRALFANDAAAFAAATAHFAGDLRDYARRLAAPLFSAAGSAGDAVN